MLLNIKDLICKAGDFILGPVNISLERGSYLALFGPSGSGKSLFLETIAGIRRAESGSIMIDGNECIYLPPQKRPVAMLFQDYALFPHLSVFENIAFALKMRGEDKVHQIKRVDELCRYLSIEKLKSREPDSLSGGEKQRVALARAIAPEPLILLLDEPLSALDENLRGEASELLRKINLLGITIIHVTHNKEEIAGVASQTQHFPPESKF
ncbi:MAG: hypothetical protein A2X19_00930 [Bacteroidetes bacterium GWE2_39_28]|jgi:ABC-type Fe3+/spermidine/putrescine transport system ATPase subunit|nr:MAG: hypothetical protein A2X19_00930 [Bacteroidetes bacterium GWE2_39_28]OFY12451.1 MAG: hypothetical protein A2X16_10855 [Bacteroidetes bacterium GWF2_39_10]HCT93396.1 hypothetical protein [Rikenellaceae bacterium]HCV16434.1 hypothetical protein [Rikenellaceae bacterium]